MTTGARTLLLHGLRNWLQMIDEMFQSFSLKAINERLNSLQIYYKGRTPEYIMYRFNVEEIPVK